MRRVLLCACLTLALWVPCHGWCWDDEPGVILPKLVGNFPASARVKQVTVSMSGSHAVSVTYQIVHKGAAEGGVVLTSYAPIFGWQSVATDYPDMHFPELALRIDGRLINKTTDATAFFNGQDITSSLRHANLDPMLVASGDQAVKDPAKLPKAARSLFSFTEDAAFPLWQAFYRQAWRVAGVQDGESAWDVTYQARPAKSEVQTGGPAFAAAVIAHCGTVDGVMRQLAKRRARVPETVVMETSTIPLQLANLSASQAVLSITSDRVAARGQMEKILSLSCGREDAPVMGFPGLDVCPVATRPVLSVLQIFLQS